jgi:hypothetical protein
MRGKKRTALPCLEALALQNGPECLGRHDTTLIRSATLTPRTAHAHTSWRRAEPGTAKVANFHLDLASPKLAALLLSRGDQAFTSLGASVSCSHSTSRPAVGLRSSKNDIRSCPVDKGAILPSLATKLKCHIDRAWWCRSHSLHGLSSHVRSRGMHW